MMLKFIILTFIAVITPQFMPGVKVKGFGTAALIALTFALLNLVVGWLLSFLLTLLSLPAIVLSLGLLLVIIPAVVNAILLKIVDAVLDQFELGGWWQAFAMGMFFAFGSFVADRISG